MKRATSGAIVVLFSVLWFAAAADRQLTITVQVDASDAARKIFHARMHIPAPPGPLTLLYPKWIPGEHGPSGPVGDLLLKPAALGKELPWKRDPVDMYSFHLTVPAAADGIDVAIEYLAPASASGFSSGSSATAHLAVISWNQVILYPAGLPAANLRYAATLTLPPGWQYGTALTERTRSGRNVEFNPVPLDTLIDSPVLAGEHFRRIDLAPGMAPERMLDIAADSATALEISDDQLRGLRRLIQEAEALFGCHHYDRYHFLLSLSDYVAHFGLEHHQSSDNRLVERALLDDSLAKISGSLLPHEYVHSWNGKYRRPQGLVTASYDEPMNTGLLWVYEGLTQYLGNVLTARSGLWGADDFRETLALDAAQLDVESGRRWRSLEDTAVAAQLLYFTRPDWANLRRGVDFYDEGALVWLEADALIRRKSQGKRSLDDFCRLFFGGSSGPAELRPFRYDDLLEALNTTLAYDWRGFFHDRVEVITPRAPLGGILEGGWNLVFGDRMPAVLAAEERNEEALHLELSLGILVKNDGAILDVNPDLPAGKAGLAPGMKILQVDGRDFEAKQLRAEMADSARSGSPLRFRVEADGGQRDFRIECREPDRFPRLERNSAKSDILSEIIKPVK